MVGGLTTESARVQTSLTAVGCPQEEQRKPGHGGEVVVVVVVEWREFPGPESGQQTASGHRDLGDTVPPGGTGCTG